jgi:DNA polymerase III delta prime subunit
MKQSIHTGITVFFSYVQADQALRELLVTHLSQLKRDGQIEEWSDQQILPGSDRSQEIDQAIRRSCIILFLISADFLASDAHYQIEMQHALERHQRGEARVIPIIVRPCDWQHSPFAHLQCLPRNNKPITSWDNQDEAFAAVVKALREIIAQRQFPSSLLSNLQRQNRAQLLKRVRDTWIKGLLEHSLYQVAWIDLHLQEQPDALENPWRFQVQELDHLPRALPMGTSIIKLYDEADGELLLLGDPGSGKTTLLLQLARTLLDRAEADELLPIPVVFNLSSWAEKKESLALWLVDELKTKYHIPHQVGQHWIRANQVLPLLDGLDEVAEEARMACVQAIIVFYHQYPSQTSIPLVLCCRSEEYRTIPLNLPLQRAVSILPLTNSQIDVYLSSAQGRLEGLRQALYSNTELYEFARRPLMLNVFALASQDLNVADLPTASTSGQILHAFFTSYVKRMLSRRRKSPYLWRVEQIAIYLTFLAKQMRHHNLSNFYVENLQPDWLSNKLQQRFYLGAIGALLGACFGAIIVGLLGSVIVEQTTVIDGMVDLFNPWIQLSQITEPIILLILGAILGFFFGSIFGVTQNVKKISIQPVEILNWSGRNIKWIILQSLLVGCIAGLLNWRLAESIVQHLSWLSIGAFNKQHNGGLLACFIYEITSLLVGGAIYAIISFIRPYHSPPLKQAKKRDIGYGILTGLFIGLFMTLLNGLLGGSLYNQFIHPLLGTSLFTSPEQLIIGESSGVLAGVIVGGLTGFSRDRLDDRARNEANQGIRRSLQYGLRSGIIAWLLGSTIFLLISGLKYRLFLGPIFGLFPGLIFGLLNGGIAWIQHILLRYVLWRGKFIPLNYSRFLDEAAERILLYRVGGGYIFVHRFLLEYFASLDEPITTESSFPAREV